MRLAGRISTSSGRTRVRWVDLDQKVQRPTGHPSARDVGSTEVYSWEEGASLIERRTGKRPTRRGQQAPPESREERLRKLRAAAEKASRNASSRPRKRKVPTEQYDRLQANVDYVIERADGVCECGCGEAYEYGLDSHHVWALKDGGPDWIENMLAIRPDCHRRAGRDEAFNDSLYVRLAIVNREVVTA